MRNRGAAGSVINCNEKEEKQECGNSSSLTGAVTERPEAVDVSDALPAALWEQPAPTSYGGAALGFPRLTHNAKQTQKQTQTNKTRPRRRPNNQHLRSGCKTLRPDAVEQCDLLGNENTACHRLSPAPTQQGDSEVDHPGTVTCLQFKITRYIPVLRSCLCCFYFLR